MDEQERALEAATTEARRLHSEFEDSLRPLQALHMAIMELQQGHRRLRRRMKDSIDGLRRDVAALRVDVRRLQSGQHDRRDRLGSDTDRGRSPAAQSRSRQAEPQPVASAEPHSREGRTRGRSATSQTSEGSSHPDAVVAHAIYTSSQFDVPTRIRSAQRYAECVRSASAPPPSTLWRGTAQLPSLALPPGPLPDYLPSVPLDSAQPSPLHPVEQTLLVWPPLPAA